MKVIIGNLITLALLGKFDVIIHGCNCFHTMGGGIANQIRKTFPEAYKMDTMTIKGDRNKLGDFSSAVITRPNDVSFVVVNAYTQYGFGAGRQTDYEAIADVFENIKKIFGNKGLIFGYPRIGAGLGGGSWETISKIIDEKMEGEEHILVEFSE